MDKEFILNKIHELYNIRVSEQDDAYNLDIDVRFEPKDIEKMKVVIQELTRSNPEIDLESPYVRDNLDKIPCGEVCEDLMAKIDAIWVGKSYTDNKDFNDEVEEKTTIFSGIITGDIIKYSLEI